jgi:hypothetical protein
VSFDGFDNRGDNGFWQIGVDRCNLEAIQSRLYIDDRTDHLRAGYLQVRRDRHRFEEIFSHHWNAVAV